MKRYIKSSLVDTFLEYHENPENYRRNPSGFDMMYEILSKYGDESEDVDVIFERATPEDQKKMIELIKCSSSVHSSKYVKSSDLGRYVGGRLLTTWTASLLVYGAEESEDYDFEETAEDLDFNEALKKLDDFQSIINDNDIDGYLTLEDYNSDYYYQGDYDQICEQLETDGLM